MGITKLDDNELANKVTELIVIYLAQKSDAIDENSSKDKQNSEHLYEIIKANFQSDAEAAQFLSDIEKIENFKVKLAERIKSDRGFSEKIHKLVENEPNKKYPARKLGCRVQNAITISAIAIILYFLTSAFVYYSFPEPYQPEPTHPIDNGKAVGFKESLSWIGGNPDIPIISTMLRLVQRNPGSRITYYIYLYNKTGRLIDKGTKVGDYDRTIINYQPNEPFEQDERYYWKVVAVNDFNKIANGENYTFETRKGPIINISEDICMLGKREYAYEDNKSGARINVTSEGNGKIINISYFFPKKGTWVGLYKRLNRNELYGTKGITFKYRAGGAHNTLELKFAYGDKDSNDTETTYQYLWPHSILTNSDIPIKIEYKNIVSGWNRQGPHDRMPTDLDINKATSIHFALSNKYKDDEKGAGWITIEDIRGIVNDT